MEADEYISDKKREMAERNALKFGCYVLEVGQKDMSMHEIKMLGHSIEEGVNEVSKANNGEMNFKANYQRYVFDFFKDVSEEDDNENSGYTEKINLNIGKSYGAKKNRLMLNYYAIAFGASIKIEYEVEEEKTGKNKFDVLLNSGDAFVVNSKVLDLSYTVKETTNKYMQELVIKNGCLLLQAEKD